MTRKKTSASVRCNLEELLFMQEQAKEIEQKIAQITLTLYAKKQELERIVMDYKEKRKKLVERELHVRHLTWCTCCLEAVHEGAAEVLLLEGKRKFLCGEPGEGYGFSNFAELHRVCPSCRERAADKSGQGGLMHKTGESSVFHAFRVEGGPRRDVRDDEEYRALRFGSWTILWGYSLPEMPRDLREKLAEEWGLPPRMEVMSLISSSEEELIIHKYNP